MTESEKASKDFDDAMNSDNYKNVYYNGVLVVKDGVKVERDGK